MPTPCEPASCSGKLRIWKGWGDVVGGSFFRPEASLKDSDPAPPPLSRARRQMMKLWLARASAGQQGTVGKPAGALAADKRRERGERASKFFTKHLGIKAEGKPGRPSFAVQAAIAQRLVLVGAYSASLCEDSVEVWWLNHDEAAKLRVDHGWPLVQPAAGLGTGTGGVLDQDAVLRCNVTEPERVKYGYTHPLIRILFKNLMHVWSREGKHLSWRTTKEYQLAVLQNLHHAISDTTAWRQLRDELRLWNLPAPDKYSIDGRQCLRERPKMVKVIMNDLVQTRREAQAMNSDTEPCFHQGRPFVFLEVWYQLLIETLEDVLDIPGFGPDMVAYYAANIYREKMALDCDDGEWVPSTSWCTWFITKKMGLTPLRQNGAPITKEQAVKAEALHKVTQQKIAIARADGLEDKFIMGADEFGMHFFPQGPWRWAKKGSKNTGNLLKEDKRQYTGDVAHNARGDIVCVHQIFAGLTNRSLPDEAIRSQFPQFQFAVTSNHWANHDTKVAFVMRLWKWTVKEYAKDKGISEEVHSPPPPSCSLN